MQNQIQNSPLFLSLVKTVGLSLMLPLMFMLLSITCIIGTTDLLNAPFYALKYVYMGNIYHIVGAVVAFIIAWILSAIKLFNIDSGKESETKADLKLITILIMILYTSFVLVVKIALNNVYSMTP